jgi:hypothetical protein
MVIPCQVSEQSLLTKSLTLSQARRFDGWGVAGGGAGRSASDAAFATRASALITSSASTDLLINIFSKRVHSVSVDKNALYSAIYISSFPKRAFAQSCDLVANPLLNSERIPRTTGGRSSKTVRLAMVNLLVSY